MTMKRQKKVSDVTFLFYLRRAMKWQLFRIAEQRGVTMSFLLRTMVEENFGPPTQIDEANARQEAGEKEEAEEVA